MSGSAGVGVGPMTDGADAGKVGRATGVHVGVGVASSAPAHATTPNMISAISHHPYHVFMQTSFSYPPFAICNLQSSIFTYTNPNRPPSSPIVSTNAFNHFTPFTASFKSIVSTGECE